MGAYFFNNCELGTLSCEEDLNTLKHSATAANEMHFTLDKYDQQLIQYAKVFFRYLYQKAPFTLSLQKIKFDIKLSVNNNELLYSLLLDIEKNINKYIIAKKFNIQNKTFNSHKKRFTNSYDSYYDNDNSSNSNSNDGQESYSSSSMSRNANPINNNKTQIHTIIKISYTDLLYRIKQIFPMNNFSTISSLMNYYGIMALSNPLYDTKTLCSFYLNINRNEYDHLLPMNLSCGNIGQFIQSIEHFVSKHQLTNFKLPVFLIKQIDKINEDSNYTYENLNLNENLNENFPNKCYSSSKEYSHLLLDKTITMIKGLKDLKFVDLSFAIYVEEINEINIKMKYILNKFHFKYNNSFDYIIRFYVFSGRRLNLYRKRRECEIEFKKAIANLPNRKYSYVMLYIFKEEIVKSNISPQCNPYLLDSTLDCELDEQSKNYHNLQNTNKWINRNKLNMFDDIEQYNPIYKPLLMSKSIYKIYSNTEYEISWFLRAINSKNTTLHKLRKKTIISLISKFISIGIKREVVKPNQKSSIYQKVYDIQVENIIPMVKRPRNEKELHSDIVHCHYDEVYNLLEDRKDI